MTRKTALALWLAAALPLATLALLNLAPAEYEPGKDFVVLEHVHIPVAGYVLMSLPVLTASLASLRLVRSITQAVLATVQTAMFLAAVACIAVGVGAARASLPWSFLRLVLAAVVLALVAPALLSLSVTLSLWRAEASRIHPSH